MGKKGSIFSEDKNESAPESGKPKPTPAIQPMTPPKRKFRITYPIFRDILLALVFLVALPLEMFAPEMYKPSTWIGTRLGLMSGQQQSAAADDAIDVAKRTALETADAQASAQTTITRGTADAQADAAAINAAQQADIRLVEQARLESTLAEVKLQIQLHGQCEGTKLNEYHSRETQCVSEQGGSYGVCANMLDVIRNRECPALPDPKEYPESLREFVQDSVDTARKKTEENRKRFEQGG